MTNQEPARVDPVLAYEGYAHLRDYADNPIRAVQAAYNKAATATAAAGLTPVLIRVLVHVAPQELMFDDTPLVGGVCDMSPGCESCQ